MCPDCSYTFGTIYAYQVGLSRAIKLGGGFGASGHPQSKKNELAEQDGCGAEESRSHLERLLMEGRSMSVEEMEKVLSGL